jgi:hypothetical protein
MTSGAPFENEFTEVEMYLKEKKRAGYRGGSKTPPTSRSYAHVSYFPLAIKLDSPREKCQKLAPKMDSLVSAGGEAISPSAWEMMHSSLLTAFSKVVYWPISSCSIEYYNVRSSELFKYQFLIIPDVLYEYHS